MNTKETIKEYYIENGKYKHILKDLVEMNIGICESAFEHYFKDKELNENLIKEIDARIEKQAFKKLAKIRLDQRSHLIFVNTVDFARSG